MRLINPVKLIPVFIIASTLSACATEDMTSELSQPNYGMRRLNSDEKCGFAAVDEWSLCAQAVWRKSVRCDPVCTFVFDGGISLFATSAVGVVFIRPVSCPHSCSFGQI